MIIDGLDFHRPYLWESIRSRVRFECAGRDYSLGRERFKGDMDGVGFWKKPLCQSLDCNRILGERRE